MKKNLRYIYLAFSASLIITISSSILLYKNISTLKNHNEGIVHAQNVLKKIQDIRYNLLAIESNQRGFLITRDTAFLEEAKKVENSIYYELDNIKTIVSSNQLQLQNLIKLKSIVAFRLQILAHSLESFSNKNKRSFFATTTSSQRVLDDFNNRVQMMETEEMREVNYKQHLKKEYERASPNYLLSILIVSVIFQLLAVWRILREFKKRHHYQKQLEKQMNELNMSRNELEQIAFIASHDLQEPLRKMRTFAGRLLSHYKNGFDDEGQMMLTRLDAAAQRLQGLIHDVVDYTNLINSEESLEKVDLNVSLVDVQKNLENLISNHSVTVSYNKLPTITGYPYQLQLLFTNLIHNSVKFAKAEKGTIIKIHAEETELSYDEKNLLGLKNEPYLWIRYSDNGIGFENEFAKRIFEIFQRLHNQQSNYDGKGIGLAICKRVMTNHGGFISAEGNPGNGATFNLYFPL